MMMMMSKLIFIWCLSRLCLETHAEYSPRHSRGSRDGNQCVFDVSQYTYDVTDLLRCMNELVKKLSAQTDGETVPKLTDQSVPLLTHEGDSKQFPYGDIIANLFNEASSVYQNLPSDSSNYQLDYPNADRPPDEFGGFRLNLFDALSSISRHDNLKCVPRILCEIASGNPPGEYKRASAWDNEKFVGLQDLGRNVLVRWLAGFDVAETSPVLSFARAAALGYSSGGNPATCYRAFPRCPRNPDKLVHYLNNHNGGFFRFFSRVGSYPRPPYALRGNAGSVGEKRRKAPPPGIAGAEADRTGTGELKFDIPVLIARQDYERRFFPRKENILENSGRVVFPDQEKSE